MGDPARVEDASRLRAPHAYVFEQIASPFQEFETDVLIIGSGAGGGVVASEMARKGWKTMVVEKGRFVTPQDFAGTPRDGFPNLYEQGGSMAT